MSLSRDLYLELLKRNLLDNIEQGEIVMGKKYNCIYYDWFKKNE